MKKLLFLSTLTTLVFASSALENRVNYLEEQIKVLKQDAKDHRADLDEYIPVIESSEVKTILDKVNFSPELEVRTDKLYYKVGEIGGGENTLIYGGDYDSQYRRKNYTKDFSPATAIYFKLNMSAKIDKNIKFYGRMIFATSSQSNERLCILSRDIKSVSSTSAFDVDRAYVDYSTNIGFSKPFTFTFGMLPTTGGTPMHFARDEQRKSMFPALVFDMNTYGVIGTQQIFEESYLRFILAKAYTLRSNFYQYQCNRENIDNADVIGAYFDTKLHFLQNTLFSFGINYLANFKAHPYLGPDVDASNAHDLGDILTFGIGLDVANLNNTGLTLFAHAAISNPHGNGAVDDYQIVAPYQDELTADGSVGFSVASYAKGEMISDNGYSVYVGTRYAILKNIDVGLEYNHGSKYWFSATQGSEDIYNKLATRGDVAEIYGMWKFNKYIHIKLGYMYTNENYTGSGWHFGEPVSKDGEQHVTYLSIKAKF